MDNNKIDTWEFSQDFYDAVTVLKACADGAYLYLTEEKSIQSETLANGLMNQMDKVVSMASFLHEEILNKYQDFEKTKAEQVEAMILRLDQAKETKDTINKTYRQKYACDNLAA